MKVQFDWQFEDEGELGIDVPSRQGAETRKMGSYRLPWCARCYADLDDYVPKGGTVYSAGLTQSQRRLLAALARTKPWLCPSAQPEPFGRNRRRRGLSWDVLRARIWNRVGRQGEGVVLTRSQRRLHAALARTRPWLCPYGRLE